MQTWPIKKHNETVISEGIGSQDLFIATPELHYNKMDDQHPLLEKPQPAESHERPKKVKGGLAYHDEAVQTDLTPEQITRMEQEPFNHRDEFKKRFFFFL